MHNELTVPAQVFGQQGALHVTAQGVLRRRQQEELHLKSNVLQLFKTYSSFILFTNNSVHYVVTCLFVTNLIQQHLF